MCLVSLIYLSLSVLGRYQKLELDGRPVETMDNAYEYDEQRQRAIITNALKTVRFWLQLQLFIKVTIEEDATDCCFQENDDMVRDNSYYSICIFYDSTFWCELEGVVVGPKVGKWFGLIGSTYYTIANFANFGHQMCLCFST